MTSYSAGEIHLVPATRKYNIAPPEPIMPRDRESTRGGSGKAPWTTERRFNHAQALRAAKARKR